MSDHSEMLDAEETSLAAVTDDSCTVKYIEIVPLDRPADDDCKPEFIDPFVVVKPEDLQDAKQEPADEIDSEDTYYPIKVRFLYAKYIIFETCYIITNLPYTVCTIFTLYNSITLCMLSLVKSHEPFILYGGIAQR